MRSPDFHARTRKHSNDNQKTYVATSLFTRKDSSRRYTALRRPTTPMTDGGFSKMHGKLSFGIFLSTLLLSSCNQAPKPNGTRATVTVRDGTLVGGAVVSTSSSEIKLLGDDQVTRTLEMSQVKSIDYEQPASTAAATAPAATSPAASASNTTPPASSAPANASAPEPAPNPRDVAPDGHEHPAEAAITTKTYRLPVGTELSVRTEETIDSGKAVEGQTFAAEISQTVRDDAGAVVIPRGANAQIIILSSSRGSHFTNASDLGLDLKSVAIGGQQYRISTVDLTQKGKAGLGANRRTAEYSGGGAALGAIIGAIAGGGKGAAIGLGAGGGAGAITQLATKGGSIKVPAETVLTFKLDKPLAITKDVR
jgi:hypothetical protein